MREHKPDEYMELDRLVDNVTILAHAMYEMARSKKEKRDIAMKITEVRLGENFCSPASSV